MLLHFEDASDIAATLPCSVMRLDLDLTGDGSPELLLSNSQGTGNSGTEEWYIYTPIGNGQYNFLGTVNFSHLGFQVTTDSPPRVIAYYRVGPGKAEIDTFNVDSKGVHLLSKQTGLTDGGPEFAAFAAWRRQVKLRVLNSNLGTLASNAQSPWTDLFTGAKVSDAGLTGLSVVQ